LTVKPDGFKIKVRRRPGRSANVGFGASKAQDRKMTKPSEHQPTDPKPLTVLYGSNAGTCKSFAEDIQTNASDFGFAADVKILDQGTEALPQDRPVVIITASYEGLPPDNAKNFVSWLETNKNNHQALEGVSYTVFGVGNSEWHNTFHRVPQLVHQYMGGMGATTVYDTGFVDVSGDIMGPWETWQEGLWPKLREFSGASGEVKTNELEVIIGKSEGVEKLAGDEISYGFVKKNEMIATNEIGFAKKHMEVELPPSMTYRTGKDVYVYM
jgi:cytochrome P450 / NADPH-cytochrome P450 reductase